MIDFHAHILPGIDDGSSSIEESIRMLRLSYRQGVEKIVATSHFYAAKESPEHFLKRRDAAWERLAEVLLSSSDGVINRRSLDAADTNGSGNTRADASGTGEGGISHAGDTSRTVYADGISIDDSFVDGNIAYELPQIYLGAEVYYYTGISRTEDLPNLCIGNTNVLLLEMPFHKWEGRMIDEVISLAQDRELTILLAHIDRYLAWQSRDVWDELAENGVLFQVNASPFLEGWRSRRNAFRLLKENWIAVLGSDCHNMTSRKPNLNEAYTVIENKCGEAAARKLTERAEQLLAEN